MPESTAPASSTPKNIVFSAYHQPALPGGDYQITVAHTFHTSDKSQIPEKTYTATRCFRVDDGCLQLKPDDIEAVFPPHGSLGDHSNVLPHIVLTHSTLPWENSPDMNSKRNVSDPAPWLLLLVFSEAEKPETQVLTLEDLMKTAGPKFPPLSLNRHQTARDPVSVIDVPFSLLKELLPSREELKMLAHVRRLDYGEEAHEHEHEQISRDALDSSERAVIIANRLPEPGATSTVHLVSVAGRYADNGQFNFDNATDQDKIRLLSLTSWRFACVSSDHTFANMIKGLECDHRSFRLPDNKNADAEFFLKEGFVPVRHALRQGGKTLSWYRGPFVPGAIKVEVSLPVSNADALLRYHADVGMFDASYASAWELGRLLALESRAFSTSLYEWKRLRDQANKSKACPLQNNHPLEKLGTEEPGMPEPVKNWLKQISYLQGVPFKYLVPDEQLLPVESIRFFQVDMNWINCLRDGAYSIGRVSKACLELDKSSLDMPLSQISGVIIRSDVVSGYPGLLLDAYDTKKQKLEELRREYLSSNILLFLCYGLVEHLEIYQKPELSHFGLEHGPEGGYKKTLDADGQNFIKVALSNRVIDISQLCSSLKKQDEKFNSGHLAKQMFELTEKVKFSRNSSDIL